jgi:hypothetical protein
LFPSFQGNFEYTIPTFHLVPTTPEVLHPHDILVENTLQVKATSGWRGASEVT